MRISDWSSDVCSSDLVALDPHVPGAGGRRGEAAGLVVAVVVRAANPGAVGRRAAELDVQVGVAAAAGHGEHQVRGAGGHVQGEVQRTDRRTPLAGTGDARWQHDAKSEDCEGWNEWGKKER